MALGLGNVNADVVAITSRQILVRWKISKWKRTALQIGDKIKLTISVAVGSKDVFHLEALAIGIAFGLLHAFQRVFTFFFGFQHTDRKRFWHVTDLHAKQVIGSPSTFTAATFGARGFDRRRCFQLEPLIIVVPLVPQYWVDQIEAGFLFVVAQRNIFLHADACYGQK